MSRCLFATAAALMLRVASAEGDVESSSEESYTNKVIIAHGLLMGIAFAILFPLGATLLRLLNFRGLVWFHAGWQVFSYCVALAAFGMGVWIAVETDQLTASNGHPIIGIIVIAALLLQPVGGLLHHYHFVKTQRPTVYGTAHRWLGRVFLVLGVINGGLGLELSDNTHAGEIAYGVLAGFFFLLWFLVVLYDHFVRGRRMKGGEGTGKGMRG